MKKMVIFVFLMASIKMVSAQVETIDSTDYGRVMTNEYISQFLLGEDKLQEIFEKKLLESENLYNENFHYTIPIVFHFMDSDNIGEKLFEDLVSSQIEILNRNFNENQGVKSLYDEYYGEIKGNINNITFVDVTKCVNESYKHKTYHSDFNEGFADLKFTQDIFDLYKSELIPFTQQNVINVWVADLNSEFDGIASMPFIPKEKHGILIDIDDFYNYYNEKSKPRLNSLTHLIGNYFGLYSLWGLSFCTDDYVDDTPIHNVANVFDTHFGHYTACPGHEYDLEMINNFMDSGNDHQKSMFTNGQIFRLKKILPSLNIDYSTVTLCDNGPVTSRSNDLELTIHPSVSLGNTTIGVSKTNNSNNRVLIQDSNTSQVRYETEFIGDRVFQVDISNFISGVYYVFLYQNGEKKVTKRIVKI